jgi:hypothetical protein
MKIVVRVSRYTDWNGSIMFLAATPSGFFDKGRSPEEAIANLRLTDPSIGAIELILC